MDRSSSTSHSSLCKSRKLPPSPRNPISKNATVYISKIRNRPFSFFLFPPKSSADMERADKGEEEYRELNRGISHDCCCSKKTEDERGEELACWQSSAPVLLYSTPLHFFEHLHW